MATATQTAGQQTFNTAYPFDFKIKNQYQGEELPVLYIVDKIDDTSPAQEIHLELSQSDVTPYTIRTFANALNDNNYLPDQNRFNVAIGIRPGVLRDDVVSNFKNSLQKAINEAFSNEKNLCLVNGPIVRASDGSLMWFINFQNNVEVLGSDNSNWNKTIKLSGIVAEAGVGTRSTQVEMLFSNVYTNNTNGPITFSRNAHLDIINHQGKTYVPLISGVVGSNVLLNQSSFENSFSVYLQTTKNKRIPFGPDTKLSLTFPTKESALNQKNNHNYFGDKSLVGSYEISTKEPVQFLLNQPTKTGSDNDTKLPTTWKLESYLDNSESILLSFPSTGTKPNPEIARIEADISAFKEFAAASKKYFAAQDTDISQAVKSIIEPILDKIKLLPQCYHNLYNNKGLLSAMGQIRWLTSNFDSNVPEMAFSLGEAFSIENWNNKYSQLISNLHSQNVDDDSISQRINPTVIPDSKYNTSDAWSDNDFVSYVNENFEALCNKLYSVNNLNGINWYPTVNGTPGPDKNYIFPCGPIYDFLQINYIRYKFSQQLHFTPAQDSTWTIENPDAIYNILFIKPRDPFSTEQWIGTYNLVSSLDVNSTNLLTSAPGVNTYFNPTKPWSDSDFTDYIIKKFNSLLEGATNITFNGEKYVCPCQSLYDYFWYSYRASDDGILKTLNPTVDTYLDFVSYVIDFNNVQISEENGGVLLLGVLENVPGYWDTPFHIELVKAPSKLDENLNVPSGTAIIGGKASFKNNMRIEGGGNQQGTMLSLGGYGDVAVDSAGTPAGRFVVKNGGNVGIGNANPSNKLNVDGSTGIDGELELGEAKTKGNLGPGSRIDFLTAGANSNKHSIVSIEENWGLNLFGDEKRPVKVKNTNLIVDGNVGIGQPKPTVKLEVNGRIKDKTGFVMPVGSIIAFGGNTAPEGWLLCNGQSIENDPLNEKGKFADLRNTIGNTVPDLISRFIIGAATTGNYVINKIGGEETHILTAEELPAHNHEFPGDDMLIDEVKKLGGSVVSDFKYDANSTTNGTAHVYTTASVGWGQPHNNMPPYYALTYIIKY